MCPYCHSASVWPKKILWVCNECGSPSISVPESIGLTKRQTEILAWIAVGKTNKEIGAILVISWRTVQKHLEQIYRKIGVKTRTAALALVVNLNMVTEVGGQPLETRQARLTPKGMRRSGKRYQAPLPNGNAGDMIGNVW